MFQSRLQRRRQEHVREGVHHGGDEATGCGQKFGQESHLCAFLLDFFTACFPQSRQDQVRACDKRI